MAAPKGNKFWELRSKHGRDRLFESPELIWEAACEYFIWCNKNPWYKIEQIKNPPKPYKNEKGKWVKPAMTIKIPVERPYTMQGLCAYLDCNTHYFSQFEKSLDGKDDQQSKDFSYIISRIKETIYRQKFEGAALGVYNANLIARELGISDKQDNTISNPDGTPMKVTLNLG